MALQPGASVKSKWDLTRSDIGERREYELVTGTNLVEEAQVMVAGGTTAQQATTSVTGSGFGDAIPLGLAINGRILATTFTNYEAGTVPAASPYTFTLEHSNLVANSYSTFADAFVYDNTLATELEVAGAAASGTAVALAVATGIMTFHADEAGDSFYIRYRWTLTTVESLEILRQSAIGRGSESTFDKLVIAHGHCTMFTTMFDADAAWVLNQQLGTAVNGNPVTGAGGVLTIYDNNNNGTAFGRIVSLPSANDPFLGVEYNAAGNAV
ncbi:hypothetical protein LCGC14_0468800 [marine sediment metagenome]|uniref:Uncharacterized protein n=1 Tax=marine sediment metagenome TaxID=412755 RepID=A0A0F9SI13_9ZZZZ